MAQEVNVRDLLAKLKAEYLKQERMRPNISESKGTGAWEHSYNYRVWELCKQAHYVIRKLDTESDILRNLANAGWYLARHVPEDDDKIQEFRDDLHRALDKLKTIKL